MTLIPGARSVALFAAALALGACSGRAAPVTAPEPVAQAPAVDPLQPPVRPDKRYVVVDVDKQLSRKAEQLLREVPNTIKVRLLY